MVPLSIAGERLGDALAKYEFCGRQLAFSVILGGVLVPGTALALPLCLLMSKSGLAAGSVRP
jgi:multiple sugar transport system permease protein